MSIVRGGLASFLLLVVTLASTDARAQTPARFDFVFEGTTTNAQAVGYIVFDLDLLPNPGATPDVIELPDPLVLDLEITVSGAASGNGTFTIGEMDGVVWDSGGVALDLSAGTQVVGQPVSGGPWGPGCSGSGPQGFGSGCGDFNLFSGFFSVPAVSTTAYEERGGGAGPGPVGQFPFVLAADGGNADEMELTSFIRGAPASSISVPTLSFWGWLTMMGLLLTAGIAGVRLRA